MAKRAAPVPFSRLTNSCIDLRHPACADPPGGCRSMFSIDRLRIEEYTDPH